MADPTIIEEFRIEGDKVVSKVKELVSEGNVRRIALKTADGKTLLEIPLMVGVVGVGLGVILAPMWAAIGAIAALVTKVTVVVERVDPKPPTPPTTPTTPTTTNTTL